MRARCSAEVTWRYDQEEAMAISDRIGVTDRGDACVWLVSALYRCRG